jgi:formylglycine-generating enzyme required for sulfatase activity
VINVSWDEITKEYLPWLNKRLGLTGAAQYRLLTEAEWEYVARNGQPRRYVFGDDEKGLGDYAWFSANAGGRTQKVGQKGASEWGVHDIHGNVWEWVQDCHAANYDAAPVDGSAAKDTPGCSRVLRGGSWDDYPQLLRSAIRVRDLPVDRDDFLGFRLARTLNP